MAMKGGASSAAGPEETDQLIDLLLVAPGNIKVQLRNVHPNHTIWKLKQDCETHTNIPQKALKFILKGKEPTDEQTVQQLALKQNQKIIVLKKCDKFPANNTPTCHAPPSPPMATDHQAMAKPKPSELAAGTGSFQLLVVHGQYHYRLNCEPGSSVRQLKQLLEPLCSAAASEMRLLARGCEVNDDAFVKSLGVSSGARIMLLFRKLHHERKEGAAFLASAADVLADKRDVLSSLRARAHRRLDDTSVTLTQLGILHDSAHAFELDLQNAELPFGDRPKRNALVEDVGQLIARVEEFRKELQQ